MKIDVYICADENMPSSRLRWINYKKDFSDNGVEYQIKHINKYVKKKFLIKSIEYADIIVIQKSILPKSVLSEFKKKCEKLIYDIDDAIWMNHSNNKSIIFRSKAFINKIILNKSFIIFDLIIASNNFIGDYIKKYNNNIKIIPTSPTDEDYIFNINNTINFKNKFIVGWTGTSNNLCYIKLVESFIKKFFLENDNCYLLIISDKKFESLDKKFNEKIINIEWSLENEQYYIKFFDVGIMPSEKDLWALGKAAYKLIYYMKNKIPTISTKWGYQTEFIEQGKNGYLVENNEEWYDALQKMYNENNISIINSAYETYKSKFSKDLIYDKYKEIFKVPEKYSSRKSEDK